MVGGTGYYSVTNRIATLVKRGQIQRIAPGIYASLEGTKSPPSTRQGAKVSPAGARAAKAHDPEVRARNEEINAAILNVIATSPRGISPSEIQDKIQDLSYSAIGNRLKVLVKRGDVKRVAFGQYIAPKAYASAVRAEARTLLNQD